MLVGKRILAVAVAFWVSASALAQSNAYVLLSQTTSGSITPFHTGTGTLGASYFVPAGGVLMAIAPGSKQVWEVVSFVSNPVLIEVLDPESGVVLASIPIGEWVGSLTFDPAGRYAYVSAAGYLIKIDVASRTVVDMVASSAYANSGLVAFSTDGSQLFLAYPGYPTGVLAVVDPVSLKTVSSVQLPFGASSILVSGNTLLVAGGTELLYLDTVTLEQTNSATVPLDCIVFAVSADGSEIYLYAHDFEGGPSLIAVLDFSTGTTLISQDVTIYLENVLMSPDGSEIVVAADPLLLIDSQTLAINRTVILVGTVAGAAFVDPKTVLLLNYAAEGGAAMVVIDQETAQITATIPMGLDNSIVADPKLGALWVGGYDASALSAVSAASNQVVRSLLVYGFLPAARVGDQIFGIDNVTSSYYNVATGATGYLPFVLNLGSDYFVEETPGATPPNGKSYWAPFIASYTGGSSGGPMQPSSRQVPPSGIGIYDTASDALVARFVPAGYSAGPFVFAPDSATAYIVSPNVIAVYDTRTLQSTQTFNYTTSFTALAISSDGATLYATDGTAIYVLDSATGALEQLFPLPPPYLTAAMALSPDGTTLFLINSHAVVYLIDTTSGQVRQVPVVATPSSIAVLP